MKKNILHIVLLLAFVTGDIVGAFGQGCTRSPWSSLSDALCNTSYDALTAADGCPGVAGDNSGRSLCLSGGGCLKDNREQDIHRFTATSTSHDITITGGTIGTYDIAILFNSGVCPTLANLFYLQCDKNQTGTTMVTATGLTIGKEYYIVVQSQVADNGTYQVCMSAGTPPSACTGNNTCGTACNITADFGNCINATLESATDLWSGVQGCQSADGHPEMWYKCVPTSNLLYIHIDNLGAGFTGDVEVIFVADGGGCTLYAIGSKCMTAPFAYSIPVDAGVTYIFTVSSSNGENAANTTFDVCVGDGTACDCGFIGGPMESYAIYAQDGSATVMDCEIYSLGGSAEDGSIGTSCDVCTPTDDSYVNEKITKYPVITVDDQNCINMNMNFTTGNTTKTWGDFDYSAGGSSTPASGSTSPIAVQYSSYGRKTVEFTGDATGAVSASNSTIYSDPLDVNPFDGGWFFSPVWTGTASGRFVPYSGGCTGATEFCYFTDGSIADAYAYLPGIFLTSGREYELITGQYVFGASAGEDFEMTVGNQRDPTSQSTVLGTWTGLTNGTCQTLTGSTKFAPTTSGTYYFAFHCISPAAGRTYLCFDDIVVKEYILAESNITQPIEFEDFINIMTTAPAIGTLDGPTAECPGTVSFQSSVANTPGISFIWSVSDPASGTSTISPASADTGIVDITFTNATTVTPYQYFLVKVDVTSECCGLLGRLSKSVAIYPDMPLPDASDQTLCVGGSQDLTVNSPVAGYDYVWMGSSAGTDQIGAGVTYTVNPVLTGVTSYYVYAASSQGCGSSLRDNADVTGTDPVPVIAANSNCAQGLVTVCVDPPVAGATYLWYDAISGGTLLSSGTSACYDVNVPAAPSSETVWVASIESGCDTSSTTSVVASTTGGGATTTTWVGGDPGGVTDWYIDANWSACVPTELVNAIIPDVANDPIIDFTTNGGGAVARCKNITINAAGTSILVMTNGTKSVLEISGTWTNNGTFTPNDGTVVFNGTSAQSLTGTTSTTFYHLEINNTTATNAVTLGINTTISYQLTLTLGHIVSTATEKLTLNAGVLTSPNRGQGSPSSFVSGYLDRVVTATSGVDYVFPIGSSTDGRWRPVTLTTADATADTWTIQYIDIDPDPALGSTYDQTDSIDILNDLYYYNVTRTGAGAVDLKIWYQDADVSGLAPTWIEGNVLIGHWNGADWDCWNKDAFADWSIDTLNNWIQVKGVSGFSSVAVGKGNNSPIVLPIELLHFDAHYNSISGNVDLTWSTASETNNDFFTVEKSKDGVDFSFVAEVAGAGNSNQTLSYSVEDEAPYNGVSYYRLKQTDYDGQHSYSELAAVNVLKGLGFTIRPNPAYDMLEIRFGEATDNKVFVMTPEYNATIQIYDTEGRVVYRKEFEGTYYKFNINVSTFDTGLYMIALTTNGEKHIVKFVKE